MLAATATALSGPATEDAIWTTYSPSDSLWIRATSLPVASSIALPREKGRSPIFMMPSSPTPDVIGRTVYDSFQ